MNFLKNYIFMKRRDFLRNSAWAATVLGCFPASLSTIARESVPGGIERRVLGKTGDKLSILGFGGLLLNQTTPEEASQMVREAFEGGINYFDVAPSYGNAEERMGPALEPFRKRVFLATKTAQRQKAEAAKELDRSLEVLRTDHLDLYQLHAVTTQQEVDTIFGSGGAIETLQAARKAGKVRLLGFSAHSVEAAMALMDRFDFDTILFPVNYATWHAGSFGPQVLAKAQEKQMGILALKAMAKRPWPKDAPRRGSKCWYEPMTDPEEALMGLRFTLSHPVTAAIHPADPNCFTLALRLTPRFTPLSTTEAEAMKLEAMNNAPLFRYPHAG
jgi:predicted aldo/keto reductase-like oxidoreductase